MYWHLYHNNWEIEGKRLFSHNSSVFQKMNTKIQLRVRSCLSHAYQISIYGLDLKLGVANKPARLNLLTKQKKYYLHTFWCLYTQSQSQSTIFRNIVITISKTEYRSYSSVIPN